ncbi:MAG TPA: protein-methionine-sulfoxide reductase heme-binding subunit MsrQ [Bryobacteraceae bacterium]|nr:protein-methionine-sulfoxide reductase heme-binding subunit MsrQ [Bryobacteraceae bacterium]
MRAAKVLVFLASLIPAGMLVSGFLRQDLGVNPVETITHSTGDWALRFLLISLCITPARKLLGRPELIRFRRMLGLFAFFYAVLHVLTWAWLDRLFVPSEMLDDISKRPYITAGTLAFLAMVPLALTSTAGWIRRLGGRRWQALHRLAYVSAAAAVVHYLWLVKSDRRLPLLYGAIFLVLMLARPLLARSFMRPPVAASK